MIAYHYALLRYSPRLAAGEFANVGVVMFTPTDRRVQWRMNQRHGRLSTFFGEFDGDVYKNAIKNVINALRTVAELSERPADLATILRHVVPPSGHTVLWSAPMGGLCDQPAQRLDELFAEFVTRWEKPHQRERTDETAIAHGIDDRLRARGLYQRLDKGVEIGTSEYAYTFQYAWKNGQRQVLEPISLDYLTASHVKEKANTWVGRLVTLAAESEFQVTTVVAPPRPGLSESFENALSILRRAPNMRRVVTESNIDAVIEDIERDLAHS